MKVLVVCQYYYPEPVRHPDFCEELVKRGHEVTVVTDVPNYPMGIIYDGYRNGEKRDEVINGVKIHRCFTIGRKTGVLYRFLNYYSYAISSTKYVNKLKDDYDVVFVNQLSPVMMACAGIKYKKIHNKKLVLYCYDLWPESLVAGGIKRNSLIFKVFHRISEKIYKQADKILVTSKSFEDYFENEFGIRNTEYLPQYAEAIFDPAQCKKTPDDKIDLMFAGNLGTAQSICTIIEAARLMQNIPNLWWHIVGDGSEFEHLKKQAEGLANVIFYGRKPLEEMPQYYAKADAMLVTMCKDQFISMTLPGKVQTYMAAGKPIIGAIDGEANLIIRESNSGICVEAENSKKLAEAVNQFIESDTAELGNNSKEYYDSVFTRERFVEKLIETLKSEIIR